MRSRVIAGALLAALVAGMWAPARADGPPQLPNLVPHLPKDVGVGPSNPSLDDPESVPAQNALRFTTTIANRGSYALDLLGEPGPDLQIARAQQCINWVGRACFARRDAGEFFYHAVHDHWHFEGFAIYELRRLSRQKGILKPNMSDRGLISTSGKVSFCLIDSSPDDPQASFFAPNNPAFYNSCRGLLQGISPGWTDIYPAGTPGQEVSISGVADGLYALVFTIDPDGRLWESDETDNLSWVVMELYESGTKARVVMP